MPVFEGPNPWVGGQSYQRDPIAQRCHSPIFRDEIISFLSRLRGRAVRLSVPILFIEFGAFCFVGMAPGVRTNRSWAQHQVFPPARTPLRSGLGNDLRPPVAAASYWRSNCHSPP